MNISNDIRKSVLELMKYIYVPYSDLELRQIQIHNFWWQCIPQLNASVEGGNSLCLPVHSSEMVSTKYLIVDHHHSIMPPPSPS